MDATVVLFNCAEEQNILTFGNLCHSFVAGGPKWQQ